MLWPIPMTVPRHCRLGINTSRFLTFFVHNSIDPYTCILHSNVTSLIFSLEFSTFRVARRVDASTHRRRRRRGRRRCRRSVRRACPTHGWRSPTSRRRAWRAARGSTAGPGRARCGPPARGRTASASSPTRAPCCRHTQRAAGSVGGRHL